jgi:tRNA nucleotidyltransferase/poly(A) polymerase
MMRSGDELAEAIAAAYPELERVAAASPDPVYLVGGAVRDLLLGRGRADIDLAVEGEPEALAAALGAEILAGHPRFGTLKIDLEGEEIDIAAGATSAPGRCRRSIRGRRSAPTSPAATSRSTRWRCR